MQDIIPAIVMIAINLVSIYRSRHYSKVFAGLKRGEREMGFDTFHASPEGASVIWNVEPFERFSFIHRSKKRDLVNWLWFFDIPSYYWFCKFKKFARNNIIIERL
mgnify:CR=1 FL=1